MIIHKNIHSGKSFIYIKDIDWAKFQVVTPLNQIKIVERHLFEDEIDGTEADFLKSGTITANQLKVYQDYQRNREEDQQFGEEKLPLQHEDSQKLRFHRNKNDRRRLMKTIEIDDEVYAYLQSQAIPFEEPTPNRVIRRLLGFERKAPLKERPKRVVSKSNGSKAPKANLVKLVQHGILQEGQKLFFNYKGQRLNKEYEAEIAGDKILYKGNTYAMSSLVAEILDNEGLGIQSKAYRGPEYWCTSDGISIRQLWEQFLKSGQ